MRSPKTCSGTLTFARMTSNIGSSSRPARNELAHREAQPLVVDLRRGGAEPETADVWQVGDAHRVAGNPAVSEDRPHHVDVEEVARAHPGVVGGDHVTGFEGLGGELREHVAKCRGRGAGERRNAVAPLRHRVPVGVEDHDRQVPALAHDGRERAADEGGDDLVGDPDEPVPHDGQAHGVDCVRVHEVLSSARMSATNESARSDHDQMLVARPANGDEGNGLVERGQSDTVRYREGQQVDVRHLSGRQGMLTVQKRHYQTSRITNQATPRVVPGRESRPLMHRSGRWPAPPPGSGAGPPLRCRRVRARRSTRAPRRRPDPRPSYPVRVRSGRRPRTRRRRR